MFFVFFLEFFLQATTLEFRLGCFKNYTSLLSFIFFSFLIRKKPNTFDYCHTPLV